MVWWYLVVLILILPGNLGSAFDCSYFSFFQGCSKPSLAVVMKLSPMGWNFILLHTTTFSFRHRCIYIAVTLSNSSHPQNV